MKSTRMFFDEMARRYDSDVIAVGWDPVARLRTWPFVVPAGARVLDAACGTGAVLASLAGAARTLAGFDLSPEMITWAKRRSGLRGAELEVADLGAPWPRDDASADVVLCLAALEFVPDLDVAFDELARVLTPGGRALITVEDVVDAGGIERPEREERYGRFPLWRRTWDDIDVCLPPALEVVRRERLPGYTVLELDFTCAYHVVELSRLDL